MFIYSRHSVPFVATERCLPCPVVPILSQLNPDHALSLNLCKVRLEVTLLSKFTKKSFPSRSLLKFCSRRDSSFGIVVRLRTGKSQVRIAAGVRICSLLLNIQNGSEAHAACYLVCSVVQLRTFCIHNKEWAVLFNGLRM